VLGASLIFAYVVRRSVYDLTAVRTDVYVLCGDLRDDAHFVTNCNNASCSDLYSITNVENVSSSSCMFSFDLMLDYVRQNDLRMPLAYKSSALVEFT
jgi:hypothetical protein